MSSAPLEERARDALRRVRDPEIGCGIVDVGLVYGIELRGTTLRVRLTMTSRACPMSETIIDEAYEALEAACPEADMVEIELVWDPPWDPSMMSQEAKRSLGWEG